MAGNKTIENDDSVNDFLLDVENLERRNDAIQSLAFYKEITGLNPKMWGPSIVGFGKYHYVYKSGREGNYFRVGFAPRKASMTYYIMSKFPELDGLLARLGKHKMTESCLYIKRLSDIDLEVLLSIVKMSFAAMNEKYPVE